MYLNRLSDNSFEIINFLCPFCGKETEALYNEEDEYIGEACDDCGSAYINPLEDLERVKK